MNIGLIGCGRVAQVHINAYKHIKDAKVVAVADLIPDRVKILANKWKIEKTFTNHMNLLEIEDLDFVDICTPPSTHANVVCDAARFGHNILVEKPMARSTAECERMIAEAKKHGTKLCVCHNQRFYSSVVQAKFMVDQGYYDLLSLRRSHKIKVSHAPQWIMTPQEGGLVWEEGYHYAYLQLYFLQNVKEVYAIGSRLKSTVYDNFTVLLRTRKHSYGIIEFNPYSKEYENILEINSLNGNRARIDLDFDYLLDMSAPQVPGLFVGNVRGQYRDLKRLLAKTKHRAKRFLRNEGVFGIPTWYFAHYQLISSYMNSLREDSAPPVPPEEGRNTVKLLECIKESLDTRQPIPIK